MLKPNPHGDSPSVDNSSFVDPTAVVIGAVTIGKNVFIAPGAVIRADEPESSIIIGDNCDIQDRAIIHALHGTGVSIGENTSVAHGGIVHGPCVIGKNCFIGFGSVVFKTKIGDEVCIKHLAVVENIDIPSGKLIDSASSISSAEDVGSLKRVDDELKKFAKCVISANLELVKKYKK
ncbi:MAG: carbonate dehydratase [Candidatus Omnitrophica bacterium]|nr:carbonate dehydratase [Candidatus Omnitrophota bacterium]